MSQRMDRRTFAAALAALCLPAVRASASPRAPRVAIGAPSTVGPRDAREALDHALRDELARSGSVELVDEARAAFVLNPSVRRESTGCVVSLVVEERRSGRLRAILEGSARVPAESAGVETSALVRVAVRSALRSLGRALA